MPRGTDGTEMENVSHYWLEIEAADGLSIGAGVVRGDVGMLVGVIDPNDAILYTRPTLGAGAFVPLATSYAAAADALVATTDSFSEFVLASETNLLPVESVSSEATASGRDAAHLAWQTASETHTAHFEVQRAVAAQIAAPDAASARSEVAVVEGAGTTTEAQSFSFTDEEAPFEAEKVRSHLKQVDLDGTTTYSDAVELTAAPPEQFTLHGSIPNPSRQATTVRYELPEARRVVIEVYDVLGQRVATLVDESRETRRKQIRFDASELSAGVYVYRLQTGDFVETGRIVVVE